MAEPRYQPFRIGDWLVEPEFDRLSRNGKDVTIQPRAMDVLAYLARNHGHVVSADQILDDLWHGVFVGSGSVYNCINQLREALGDTKQNPAYIETIAKRGYRLIPPVEFVTTLGESSAESVVSVASPVVGIARSPKLLGLVVLAGIVILGLGYAVFQADRPGTEVTADQNSIAVMPFLNLSDDPDSEYFADGLTEELINDLQKLQMLKVAARSSSFYFKGKGEELSVIGEKLGVAHVLEGSVRRAADQLRVTTQLVRTGDGFLVWSEIYDRTPDDIFAIQADIATQVTQALRVTLLGGEAETRFARARSVDPEAYRLWLKGNFHLGKLNEASFRRAVASFQEAIDRDPNYAPAHAGLAMAYTELGGWFASVPPRDAFPLAKEAAERAVELDPEFAEAHLALGRIRQMFEWDWAGAERAFKQGIALDPSTTAGRIEYANFLTAMGRFEQSIEIGRRTLELDPLSPAAYNELAFALWFAGRDEEALQLYFEGLEIVPDFVQSLWGLSELYVKSGEFGKALEYLARLNRIQQPLSPAYMGVIGRSFGLAGQPSEARAILSQLTERRAQMYIPASALANVHVGLGEHEEALGWLEVAYEERDIFLVWLNGNWPYNRLRSDPRFQAIRDRMDFPGP